MWGSIVILKSQLIPLGFFDETFLLLRAKLSLVHKERVMQITDIYKAKQQDDQPRKPGYWEGKVKISEDFDELPEHIAQYFMES